MYSVNVNNGEDMNAEFFIGDIEFIIANSKFEALCKMIKKMEQLELDKYVVEVSEIKELDGYYINLVNKDSVDKTKDVQITKFRLGDAEAKFYNALGEHKIVKVNNIELTSKFFDL